MRNTRSSGGLTVQEARIVSVLERHPNRVISVAEMADAINTLAEHPNNLIRAVICRARAKCPDLEIDTVHKRGYVLRQSQADA